MNEIIEKQYEYILSIIEMDDFNNVSDLELNVIVYKAVEVWKRLVKLTSSRNRNPLESTLLMM